MLASTADCSRFRKLEGKRTTSFRTKVLSPTGPGVHPITWHSHGSGDLVLEGVGWDPVGSFQKDGFSIDAEIKSQSWRPDNWVLDEFYCAEIHLGRIFLFRSWFSWSHNRHISTFNVLELCHWSTNRAAPEPTSYIRIKVTIFTRAVSLTLVSVFSIKDPPWKPVTVRW